MVHTKSTYKKNQFLKKDRSSLNFARTCSATNYTHLLFSPPMSGTMKFSRRQTNWNIVAHTLYVDFIVAHTFISRLYSGSHLICRCSQKLAHAYMRDITRSIDDGLFTFRCHWNVTNCSGIWINNTRIILQRIWGGFILIQYNCDKLWNSGIIRTATKQKSKQRECGFVYFSLSLKCYKLLRNLDK